MRQAPSRLGLLASVVVSLSGCSAVPAIAPAPAEPTFYATLATGGAKVDPIAARDMISVYRHNKGLATVSVDPTLQAVAQAQADAMAQANTLSHTVRGDLSTRLRAAGYGPHIGVENVSAGYHTLAEAFSGWRQSPPHNANMLEPAARRMGIATAYAPGTKYKVFWALVMTN